MGLSSAARAPGVKLSATAMAAATTADARVAFPRPMSTISTPKSSPTCYRRLRLSSAPKQTRAPVDRPLILSRSLCGVGHHLKSLVQLRLGLGNILADAGEGFHHGRLFVGRQADQLTAIVGPRFAGVVVERRRGRAKRGRG